MLFGLDRIYHWLSHFMCPKSIEFMSKNGTLDDDMTKMENNFSFIWIDERQQTSRKLLKRQQKKWHSLISCSTWRRLENVMRIRNEKKWKKWSWEKIKPATTSTTTIFDRRRIEKIFSQDLWNFYTYIESRIFFTSYEGRRQLLPSAISSRIRMTFNFQLTSRILSKFCLPIFQPICFFLANGDWVEFWR